MPTGSALQFIQAYLSAQAQKTVSVQRCFIPSTPSTAAREGLGLWPSVWCKHALHPHPLQQPAGISDRDQGSARPAQPVVGMAPAVLSRVPAGGGRVRAACAARGGSRRGGAALRAQPAPPAPVCPGAASRRAPLAARPPSLPPSLRPVRSRPQREGRETGSTLVPHVSRRAEVIMNDRHTFHNSCNAVVTQPAVVMP